MGAKKNKAATLNTSIKKQDVSNLLLKFSFDHFSAADAELCPANFADGYVQALMDRLKNLSTWKVSEFLTPKGQAVRNHILTWARTSRPDGFTHLNKKFQSYPAYQFQISANDRGRVHGLLIDDTFHVVWLDQDHKLYP